MLEKLELAELLMKDHSLDMVGFRTDFFFFCNDADFEGNVFCTDKHMVEIIGPKKPNGKFFVNLPGFF